MDGSIIRTPIREFIESGQLWGDNILFNEEFDEDGSTPSQPLHALADRSSTQNRKNLLHSLNATKLALMLAKAFEKLGQYSGKEDRNHRGIDLEPLQPGNFFVRLRLGETAASKCCAKHSPLLAGEVDERKDQLKDDLENFHLLSDVDDGPPIQTLDASPPLDGNPPASIKSTWEVIDIDILLTSSGVSDQGTNCAFLGRKMTTPMQILGSQIHAIYSRSKKLVPPLIQNTAKLERGNESGLGRGEDSGRRSKLRVLEGSSVFSTLVESGEYPISVCRLLSDMIDLEEGKGNCPFTSLEEVIHDLYQMACHPQTFLYDQCNEFYASNLRFGQSCYGRVKELTNLLEVSTRLEQTQPSSDGRSEAVFVSGVGGSGKSHFVGNFGRFLSKLGWMVLMVKFKRGLEHESRVIVSSLFEDMIGNLISMRDGGNGADIDYSRRATEAILNALDSESLSSLANFLPIVHDLLPAVVPSCETDISHWQLFFLLSKLLRAILSLERNIMICFDDLQWCDCTMLLLIKEIIVNVGQHQQGRQHFLFLGMYRDVEITDSHPLANQLAALKKNSNVEVSDIKLSSLSKDAIVEMITFEMRLPRRLVDKLAGVVHKKTSGHALFVVELLNSLVRDSTIAYSPRKLRFDWDANKVPTIKTWDCVASLIVSNLSYLEDDALQSLRILSCFGVQIPLSLIKLIAECARVPERGIEHFLPGLVERGVVEISDQSVFFSHDLIQSNVYDNILLKERQQLHIDLGNFIASKIALDSLLERSVEASTEELTLGDSETSLDCTSPSYPLVAIATNQVNFAGSDSISDCLQRIRFAKWNLHAGKDASGRSNFQAALYYFRSGLAFVGDDLWHNKTYKLSHQLCEGSASALFAIGDYSLAAQQASAIIDHVPFDDTLVAQYFLFRSLDSLGRYAEGVCKGLEVLRQLKFNIPDPCPSSVLVAMNEVGKASSAYSFDQMTSTHRIVGSKKRKIFKLMESMTVSFFRSASPYLPLLACAGIKYSLQNGICADCCCLFAVFGHSKVALEQNYEEARYWGQICTKILDSSTPTLTAIRADIMCAMYVNFWFYPFKTLAFRELKVYQQSTALGEIESALQAFFFSLTFSYYSGENLSLLSNSMDELIQSLMKHSKEGAKLAWQQKLLIDGLRGNSSGFPDFGGVNLIADAQSRKNILLTEAIHIRCFNLAFWMGDYNEARKFSQEISSLQSSKNSKPQHIFHAFFMGLISFQMYRDGEGEDLLEEGKRALSIMKVWSGNSAANFENKLLLLEAEYHASMCDILVANSSYEAAVRSARDNGLVHEQGLACELYAKFLSSIIETDEALCWFKCAHACYMQWGAKAKAERLLKKHNISSTTVTGFSQFSNKHCRDW